MLAQLPGGPGPLLVLALGFDDERLVFPHQGRHRLTDVHGKAQKALLG